MITTNLFIYLLHEKYFENIKIKIVWWNNTYFYSEFPLKIITLIKNLINNTMPGLKSFLFYFNLDISYMCLKY